jgi:ABC-type Na+ efflux pump permease subunit
MPRPTSFGKDTGLQVRMTVTMFLLGLVYVALIVTMLAVVPNRSAWLRRHPLEVAIVGTVRLEVRYWNVAVAALSLLLLVTLVGYFLVEYFLPSLASRVRTLRTLYSPANQTCVERGAS